MNSVVAIHQPNFFPWLGYFNKISQSDYFVFLDDVLVVKTGSSWFNRVPIPHFDNTKSMWLTVPIVRPSGIQLIRDVEIVNYEVWRERFLRVVRERYSRHPYWGETIDLINSCIVGNFPHLSVLNKRTLKIFCNELGISRCQFVESSDLNVAENSTARLVEITKKLSVDTYLCGGGSSDYFDESLFIGAGKTVKYQNFKPTVYPQYKATQFSPGMSIIDLLMNVGIANAKEFIDISVC